MAARSPGQRVASTAASALNISPLQNMDNHHGLNILYDLFMTSVGPEGRAKVVHNNCGGQVTVSSDCGRLLQSLSISKPVIKLIVAAIKEHVRLYSDAGLFTASLSLMLINEALKTDIHRRLVGEVYGIALKECVDFMQSERFPGKIVVDVNNCDDIQMKLVKNMYKSKPVCLLFGCDFDHICRLTLEGYRKSSKNNKPTEDAQSLLLYVTLDGKPPQDSKLLHGVLYESPQIPTYRQEPLKIRHNCNNLISVALIQTSMAGDSEAFLDVTYELTSDLDLSSAILTQLSDFTEAAISGSVGMVICQKVVHPRLKKMLKQQGVLVLDRLGRTLFDATHKLAGGTVLDPFSSTDTWHFTSVLGQVSHLVINNRSYVHLEDIEHMQTSTVYTVLLCHRTEQALQELKTVYERCLEVLRLMTRVQSVLCGAGCWQTSLCLHLMQQTADLVEDWSDKLGCTKLQLTQILQMFIAALGKTPLTLGNADPCCHLVDVKSGHHFVSDFVNDQKTPLVCQCGGISYSVGYELDYMNLGNMGKIEQCKGSFNLYERSTVEAADVVDAFLPAVSALKTAVSVGSMVLGIHNYVQDVN